MAEFTMVDSIDWTRVSTQEYRPILDLISKIRRDREELAREMRRTKHHLFVIADSLDYAMCATFQNHDRRET